MTIPLEYNPHAHSLNDEVNKHLNGVMEKLVDHSNYVSRLAGQFAEVFGAKDEGEITGLFHDIAKLPLIFADRLAGKSIGYALDHSTPGAAAMFIHYNNLNAVGGCLAIHGHHIGLTRGTKRFIGEELNRCCDKTAQQIRRDKKGVMATTSDIDGLLKRFLSLGLTIPKTCPSSIYSPEGKDHIQQMLNLRMLLSCLCDADVIETKAHFAGDKDTPRRKYWVWDKYHDSYTGKWIETNPIEMNVEEWKVALAALKQYIEEVAEAAQAKGEASEEIIKIREELLKACIDMSSEPVGLFTLSSPTGTGKTLAMLAFAIIHAIRNNLRRIIIVLPYLSIIDQTAEIIRKIFPRVGFVTEHHSGSKNRTIRGKDGAIISAPPNQQRIEAELTQNWDAPVIVTTGVQFLESLFACATPRLRKLHNIASSVVLMDEAQMMPYHVIISTLTALSHLSDRFKTSVVLSTATQPAFDLLKKQIKAAGGKWNVKEIVPSSIFKRMPARVKVNWDMTEVSWGNLAQRILKERQALCIVNKKTHAKELIARMRTDGVNVYHLSTDMCKLHRETVLRIVRLHLKEGNPVILVSTQCIEAGVDIDFPCVFRALAPLFSLIQAAGRCNRGGLNREMGTMHVFVPERTPDEEREQDCYPDEDYHWGAVCTRMMLKPTGLDIFNPKIIRDYCKQIYLTRAPEIKGSHVRLKKDFEERNFEAVAADYNVIEENNINIVVRYNDDTKAAREYDELAQAASDGIDKRWMAKAGRLLASRGWPKTDSPLSSVLIPLQTRDRQGNLVDVPDWFLYSGNYDSLVGITEKSK